MNAEKWQVLVNNLGDAVSEIVSSYLEDTPIRIDEMRRSLAAMDFDVIGRLAHSLKSSSGIFGAQRMVDMCKDLELAANNQGADCAYRLDMVSSAFDELAGELKRRLAELDHS